MAASYPTSIKSFTTKVDNVTDVLAAHINDLQDEVAAIETALGIGKATSVVQISNLTTSTQSSGTTTTNYDNTTPLISEGTQVMTLNHTPKKSTNILKVEVVHNGQGANSYFGSALFCPGIHATDSLARAMTISTAASYPQNLKYTYYVVAGTVSAMTFSVRQYEANAAQTYYFNQGSTALFSGFTSSINITEFNA